MSNGLMTPKSDCILHPVDFLRVHHPGVVQALSNRLRPFPRKVNLHRVGVQDAVHTGPVGEPDLGPPVLRFAPLALIMGLRLLRKT